MELREAAESLGKNGMTVAIDVDAVVYMSDTAVSNSTKEKLKAGLARLENVPEAKNDWHPGSDNRVLDLVHPLACR